MSNGFYVDLDALTNAGRGAASLMQELDQHNVSDIACDGSAVGHDRLSSALDSFCQRWQTGVKNLSNDGNKLSQHLLDTVASYTEADQRGSDLLSAIEVDGG